MLPSGNIESQTVDICLKKAWQETQSLPLSQNEELRGIVHRNVKKIIESAVAKVIEENDVEKNSLTTFFAGWEIARRKRGSIPPMSRRA